MSAAEVLAHYQALAALTERMRAAAGAEEWEALIAIQRERDLLLPAIKRLDGENTLDGVALEQKKALIESVLGADGEIRRCVEVWMAGILDEMQNNARELRLLKQYGANIVAVEGSDAAAAAPRP